MTGGLPRPVICLVTDGRCATVGDDDALVRFLRVAALAGVDLIQIREPGLDDRRLLSLVQSSVGVRSDTAARVVVNDRVDVALAAGADGVHLRADSASADRVRPLVPAGFLIGRSVHDKDEAVRAAETGVDYLIMGTIYPSASKPGDMPWLGAKELELAAKATSVPLLGIGGITADKAGSIAAAGAAGFAAIGLFADVRRDAADEALDAALRTLVAELRGAFREGTTSR